MVTFLKIQIQDNYQVIRYIALFVQDAGNGKQTTVLLLEW
jgi:hypothetical protein